MATVRELRRRIKGIASIAQVTRAMQMVAASKMRHAQEEALATRPYAAKAWEVISHLAAQPGHEQLHPLLDERDPPRVVGMVLITSDKGLCGGYNANVLRLALQFLREATAPVRVCAVGRKGRDFMIRYGAQVVAEFSLGPRHPGLLEITPIARTVIEDYTAGVCDLVWLVYTEFINTMTQRPAVRPLLPITPGRLRGSVLDRFLVDLPPRAAMEYIYEPSPGQLLGVILPRFVELQIYQAILEAQASEHSARMVAMRNATDSANELVDALTLQYYRARQEAITKEMLDIAGGAEALQH
ncbi:MAG: ATP synthase F1 subunit gamma [candidate division KSB1 bacterium]|nr:ATP synthase F1 subunit gamma [candidate division KSB1 bacterium]